MQWVSCRLCRSGLVMAGKHLWRQAVRAPHQCSTMGTNPASHVNLCCSLPSLVCHFRWVALREWLGDHEGVGAALEAHITVTTFLRCVIGIVLWGRGRPSFWRLRGEQWWICWIVRRRLCGACTCMRSQFAPTGRLGTNMEFLSSQHTNENAQGDATEGGAEGERSTGTNQ
jgi:hypothetical protein